MMVEAKNMRKDFYKNALTDEEAQEALLEQDDVVSVSIHEELRRSTGQ